MSTPDGRAGGWRARLFGDRDRLGWWLLPVFVAVGLAGAVLAGSLAVVFASQRVDRLTRETAGARAELATAVDDVREVAEDALASIRDEVAAVRDGLSTELPFDDPAAAGIVLLDVAVEVPVVPAQATAAPDDGDQPADRDPPADDAGTGADADDGTGADDDEVTPTPPPPRPEPPIEVRRRASGFVVARDGEASFVLTSFALLADPRRPATPLDTEVRVRLAAGETIGRVHSWQAERDLLLLRVELGDVPPLPWRPADSALAGGERVVAVALTPTLNAVQVGGTVGSFEPGALITDVPGLELLAGGPIVDADGRVVAMSSDAYQPFGNDPVAVPVRLLCEELLSRCPD